MSYPYSQDRTERSGRRAGARCVAVWCLQGVRQHVLVWFAVLSLVSGGRRFGCVGACRWAGDWCGEVIVDWLPQNRRASEDVVVFVAGLSAWYVPVGPDVGFGHCCGARGQWPTLIANSKGRTGTTSARPTRWYAVCVCCLALDTREARTNACLRCCHAVCVMVAVMGALVSGFGLTIGAGGRVSIGCLRSLPSGHASQHVIA